MLTIALAKGRTAEDVLPLWREAKLPVPLDTEDSRALVFEVDDPILGCFRFLLSKPVDVPTYVTFGVADIGVVGKDVLWENERDVYELLDLQVAKCKLCVAGRSEDVHTTPRRIATKYPRLADGYFRSRGVAVEIVPLSGSIELAAVIGLTDRIFDLVQTGSTLAANGLIVYDEVEQVSARLIANRSSYRTHRAQIQRVVSALETAVEARRGGPS